MHQKALTATQAKTLTPAQARDEYFPEMGRAAFYAALRRKEIPSLRLGKKFLIPRTAIEKFLENCGTSAAEGNAADVGESYLPPAHSGPSRRA